MQQHQIRKVENGNIECPCCETAGVTVRTKPAINFQKDRSYRCNDCGHWWELDDDGDRVTKKPGIITGGKNPIDYDRELGVVPDN